MMTKGFWLKTLGYAGLFLAGLGIWALAQVISNPAEPGAAAGQSLYAANCAACHGANLEGQENWQSPGPDGILPAPPHDETGHTWHHGDNLLFEYAKLGGTAALQARGVEGFKSGMPAFDGIMTDQEIRDTMAYIRSQWPKRVREIQASRTAAEQEFAN